MTQYANANCKRKSEKNFIEVEVLEWLLLSMSTLSADDPRTTAYCTYFKWPLFPSIEDAERMENCP